MNEHKDKRLIQEAVDRRLANVGNDPWLAQKVLAKATQPAPHPRRKLTVGLVIALVLMLAAVTALAVGMSHYFGSFAKLEDAYGAYEQWPGSAKVELVKLMKESGLPIDLKFAEAMENAANADDAEALAEGIIAAYFGPETTVDTYNIMLHELGQFENWPQEEKALYSSLLMTYGHQKEDWPIYLMPGENDLTLDKAVAQASRVLYEKFDVETKLMDIRCNATFLKSVTEYGDAPVWLVEFYNSERFTGVYRVVLTGAGELVFFSAPESVTYAATPQAVMEDAEFVQPGEYDVPHDEIIRIARTSICEIGSYETIADQLQIEAYFLYHEQFNYGYEPVWLVEFLLDDVLTYRLLFGYDGSYISGAEANGEFDRTRRMDEGIGADFDLNFRYYSVEEKAAFSEKWKPVVDAYAAAHPYYKNYETFWYKATRHVYGVPGEGDLSQEEAEQIAQRAIIDQGVLPETISDRRIVFTFDITDAQRPIWKVMIYHVSFDKMEPDAVESDRRTYQVIIDARSGEVLHCYDNTQGEMTVFNM